MPPLCKTTLSEVSQRVGQTEIGLILSLAERFCLAPSGVSGEPIKLSPVSAGNSLVSDLSPKLSDDPGTVAIAPGRDFSRIDRMLGLSPLPSP